MYSALMGTLWISLFKPRLISLEAVSGPHCPLPIPYALGLMTKILKTYLCFSF